MNFNVIETKSVTISLYDKMRLMSLRRYIEDYEVVTFVDEKGREKRVMKYKGPHFSISILHMEYKPYRRLSYLLFGLIILLHISSGLTANPGMYQIYVALPYAVAFLPLTFLAFGIIGLPKDLAKIQRDVMERSFKRIKINTIALLIIFTLLILGEFLFMILHPALPHFKNEMLFLIPEILASTSMLGIFLLNRKVKVNPINNG